MEIILHKVTNRCSMNCNFCPYSNNQISDEKEQKFSAQENTIYILSGGEPFENKKKLYYFMDNIAKKSSYFRIATGGHINIRPHYLRILNTPGFLGFNFGTDVIFRKENYKSREIWIDNWYSFTHVKQNWLTITLSSSVSFMSIVKLLIKTSPKIVMLNEEENGFSRYDDFICKLKLMFNQIKWIEGYRREI